MKREKTVSLWLGNVGSEEALDALVAEHYSDDGDFLGSAFSRAFAIDYYDEDFREASFHDPASSDLPRLLAGHSYDDVLIARFGPIALDRSFDAVILLYDFAYGGERPTWRADATFVRFVGTVEAR